MDAYFKSINHGKGLLSDSQGSANQLQWSHRTKNRCIIADRTHYRVRIALCNTEIIQTQFRYHINRHLQRSYGYFKLLSHIK